MARALTQHASIISHPLIFHAVKIWENQACILKSGAGVSMRKGSHIKATRGWLSIADCSYAVPLLPCILDTPSIIKQKCLSHFARSISCLTKLASMLVRPNTTQYGDNELDFFLDLTEIDLTLNQINSKTIINVRAIKDKLFCKIELNIWLLCGFVVNLYWNIRHSVCYPCSDLIKLGSHNLMRTNSLIGFNLWVHASFVYSLKLSFLECTVL